MENLMIKSVYSYLQQNGEKAFFYTVENSIKPIQFRYYILEKGEDNQPKIRRVSQAINLLQTPALHFSPLQKDSEDYELFTSYLARAFYTPKTPGEKAISIKAKKMVPYNKKITK